MENGNKVGLDRILGIILLIPPCISVILFVVNLFSYAPGSIAKLENLSSNWTGTFSANGGGFTSAAPIYLGLMAIAGALLLNGTNKK